MSFIFDSLSTGSTDLDNHLSLIRNVEWPAELGPMASWPQDLLQLAHVMMLDAEPRLLLIGSENWMLYNTSYAKSVAGDKRPKILGATQVSGWSVDSEESVMDGPNFTGLSRAR